MSRLHKILDRLFATRTRRVRRSHNGYPRSPGTYLWGIADWRTGCFHTCPHLLREGRRHPNAGRMVPDARRTQDVSRLRGTFYVCPGLFGSSCPGRECERSDETPVKIRSSPKCGNDYSRPEVHQVAYGR